MEQSDLKNNFDKIQSAANQFLHSFGPAFTNTPQGHIDTDIIGASTAAGTMILRATVTDLAKFEPGTVLLSEVHERQNSVLNFITGVALTLGVDFRQTKVDRLKKKLRILGSDDALKHHQPMIAPLEMSRRLEPKLLEACQAAGLDTAYTPYIAVLTAAKLISAGLKFKIITLNVARELLFFYVILGSKTVPYSK